MTRPLDELLSRVQGAQPSAAEWCDIQARVTAAMASAQVAASAAASSAVASSTVVSNKSALTAGASAKSTAWGTWVVSSVATGVIAAGLAVTYEGSKVSLQGDALAAAVLVQQRTTHTEGLTLPGGLGESQSESWVPPPKKTARPSAPATLPSTPAAIEAAVPEVQVRKEPLGESDVEYDRRHLAAVDDALRAGEPSRALKLLEAFQPKRLHVYASSLRAIALCNAGARTAGVELGRRWLPQITNGGLKRRVKNACGLE